MSGKSDFMSGSTPGYIWHALGDSVRGAAHMRNGLVNQDGIDWSPRSAKAFGLPIIMTLSDGHGSSKCFRSNLGAQFATKSAKDVIKQFLSSDISLSDLSIVKHLFEERLPRDLVQNWRRSVDRHIRDNPFTSEELIGLGEKEGSSARIKVEDNNYLAYGATLLAVFVTETFLAILQLGDGDILVVSDAGEVGRPLPKDERLIANETTSLSDKSPWQDFRTSLLPIISTPPALILLSTDGYSNSFRDDESFLKVGTDVLEMLRQDTPESVRRAIPDWLNEASQSGSGDDITLGIIYRQDALDLGAH